MRKAFLLPLLMLAAALVQAQPVCIPDPFAVIAGLPGLWPNPQLGPLPDGNTAQAYNETITVIVPPDTTIDLSQFGFPIGSITVSINYLEILGVTGLPPGMSYACNVSNCQWTGNSNGCFKLSGTPTQAGTFSVACSTSLNINVPNLGPFSTPGFPVTYDLTILGPTIRPMPIETLYELFVPPFAEASQGAPIRFHVPAPTQVSLELTDLNGRLLAKQSISAVSGMNHHTFETNMLSTGLYLVTMHADGIGITHRMNLR